jgi:hypothetical protein
MIFARHNFVYNFINASGSGDTFTTEQMIVDQLTRLTIEHRAKVIKALRDNGIDVKADATVEKVSKLVLENAAYNDDLSNELTDLIIEYNIPKTEWKIDADGELFKGLFNEGKEYLQGDEFKVAARTAIFNGVQKISDSSNAAKAGTGSSATPTLAEQYQERIRLAQNQAAMLKKEKEPLSTGAKIAIGIGILAVIGIIVVVVMKSGKKSGGAKGKSTDGAAAPKVETASAEPVKVE